MSRKRSRLAAAIPIGPNESGPDPQFGELSDLPKGVKRQTSFIKLQNNMTGTAMKWSRLVFSFPECLGIKETLDNAAKTTSCIPSVSMDVPINLPVIRNVQIDEIQTSKRYKDDFSLDKSTDNLKNDAMKLERAYILTGEDQLKNKAPDVADETKETEATTPAMYAALSDAIYARFVNFPDPNSDSVFAQTVAPDTWKGPDWLYGKSIGGVQGLDYKEVAQRYLQPNQELNEFGTFFEMNNILPKGHLLLKDHVNLFVKTEIDDNQGWEIRVMIDYTTKSVSLSSLLVWQQQLTEFLPKQVRWRAYEQVAADDKNGWNILISRGSVVENGTGDDPTDKSNFPDIKD